MSAYYNMQRQSYRACCLQTIGLTSDNKLVPMLNVAPENSNTIDYNDDDDDDDNTFKARVKLK